MCVPSDFVSIRQTCFHLPYLEDIFQSMETCMQFIVHEYYGPCHYLFCSIWGLSFHLEHSIAELLHCYCDSLIASLESFAWGLVPILTLEYFQGRSVFRWSDKSPWTIVRYRIKKSLLRREWFCFVNELSNSSQRFPQNVCLGSGKKLLYTNALILSRWNPMGRKHFECVNMMNYVN